jgi:hypothetical protein
MADDAGEPGVEREQRQRRRARACRSVGQRQPVERRQRVEQQLSDSRPA